MKGRFLFLRPERSVSDLALSLPGFFPFFREGEWWFQAQGFSPGASSVKPGFLYSCLFSPSACSVTRRVPRNLTISLLLPSGTSQGQSWWTFPLQRQKEWLWQGQLWFVQRVSEAALGARLISHLLSFCRNCWYLKKCSNHLFSFCPRFQGL